MPSRSLNPSGSTRTFHRTFRAVLPRATTGGAGRPARRRSTLLRFNPLQALLFQIVFRIKVSDVDLAKPLRRPIHLSFASLRIRCVERRLLCLYQLPRAVYSRVVEAESRRPTPATPAVMMNCKCLSTSDDAGKGIAHCPATGRTEDDFVV